MAILEIRNVRKYFKIRRGLLQKVVNYVRAVDGISLNVNKGQNMGLVGESGCGKSTLAKLISGLLVLDSGKIIFQGSDINLLIRNRKSWLRKDMQIVFQDPFSSLDPRFRVKDIIGEAFITFGRLPKKKREQKVKELLNLVHLKPGHLNRFPHEFSAGERQRIAVARSIANNPKFLVLDEAVSSLDVLLQRQILDLFRELKDKFGLTYLVISHNLRVVKKISKTITVMYMGIIVEQADASDIFKRPLHPYTQALFAAAIDYKIKLKGEMPVQIKIPSGCRFHSRCPYKQDKCIYEVPILQEVEDRHLVACHFSLNRV